MSANPLKEIQEYGQSIWLDFIRRSMLSSGELKSMIEADGLLGVTSNPSIFEKAIDGSHDYDESIQSMAQAGKSASEIYRQLTVKDVQAAADVFRPIYEGSGGVDGYVSLEVSPHLARDTQGTIDEARKLWAALDRPNVLIKVPATREGLPAIRTLISEGVNVNVTLLFSVDRYLQVADAYMQGIEARIAAGQPVDRIASVASFFVSRIDVLVDPRLEKLMGGGGERSEHAKRAHGQVAISCAKVAYQKFQELFDSPRFEILAEEGARPQRLLWASTSTKNPAYSDVKYVEALIGPDTVNTIPMETLQAYRDHGQPQARLEQGVGRVSEIRADLEQLGIDLAEVSQQLEDEGIDKFADAYDRLLETIERKRTSVRQEGSAASSTFNLGPFEKVFQKRLHQLEESRVAARIWEKDATLWTQDEQEQTQIKHALGWLHVIEKMKANLSALRGFADEVVEAGFEQVVHMGMGGSSLAPMLFARLFSDTGSGLPVTILDSTQPESILALEESIALEKTLFIVASKSGETAETLAFGDYFFDKVREVLGDAAGDNFVAITDPGSHLVEVANARQFRKVFLNFTDIGGRYSALSYFGLVPAMLGGVDVEELLERAAAMMHACFGSIPATENPGLLLGAALGEIAEQGRDKVTLVVPEKLKPFAMWIEQLLAESTGKQGKGLLPVEGEALGDPGVYGEDRLFVHIDMPGIQQATARLLAKLEEAGQPVIHLEMRDRLDVGKEFFRWEFATAVCGSILGINAFNQPNVQESKDNTADLLEDYERRGSLPAPEPRLTEMGIELFEQKPDGDLEVSLTEFMLQAEPGNYFALMAYLPETPEYTRQLQEIRMLLRDWLHRATTLGYGPRFLHSTGQMHKGGPNSGVFIQFSADHETDAAIPDHPYSFKVMQEAQYLGDYAALQAHDRRVIRVHLGRSPVTALMHVKELLEVGSKSLPMAYRAANRRRLEQKMAEGQS